MFHLTFACCLLVGQCVSSWKAAVILKCSSSCFQNVKILTYQEPHNPNYTEFVNNLRTDAKTMFNYTIEDSLVRSVCVCVFLLPTGDLSDKNIDLVWTSSLHGDQRRVLVRQKIISEVKSNFICIASFHSETYFMAFNL